MSAAVQPARSGTGCYQRRRPEHTLWYRTVQAHFETWLALAAGSDDATAPAYVEQAFRRYLECGILGCGLARVFCAACGHDFPVAFSCQGRAVCPSCNTRHMVETAAVGGRRGATGAYDPQWRQAAQPLPEIELDQRPT
ncbi:MAG: transposase zinc-binding domain-containing protein [Betaproteobacteria bacterium]|nr:transposase zinc-binding domain-containing protein [Betaproteobacteria bacterium]